MEVPCNGRQDDDGLLRFARCAPGAMTSAYHIIPYVVSTLRPGARERRKCPSVDLIETSVNAGQIAQTGPPPMPALRARRRDRNYCPDRGDGRIDVETVDHPCGSATSPKPGDRRRSEHGRRHLGRALIGAALQAQHADAAHMGRLATSGEIRGIQTNDAKANQRNISDPLFSSTDRTPTRCAPDMSPAAPLNAARARSGRSAELII